MFIPPFCPNPDCSLHHDLPSLKWWEQIGSYATKTFGSIQRFICATIQNRLERLARQGLALHSHLRKQARPHEDVCFDGSQYFPNDIGLSISSESRFIIGLTMSPREEAVR